MANSIKESGGGAALQVTNEARSADLATETEDDEAEGAARWKRLAPVRVYGFDRCLLVIDRERVDSEHAAELVATIARDTGSIFQGIDAQVRPAGNGCMVSLPGLADTGLDVGDRAPAHPAPNLLLITGFSGGGVRLAEDVKSIRKSQLGLGGE